MWYLILCVKFTRTQSAKTFGQAYSGYVSEDFWLILTFKLVDWVKRVAFPDVMDLISSQLKAWIEQKCLVREFFSCLSAYVGCWSLLDWSIGSSWFLSLPAFRLELTPSALQVLRPLNSHCNYTFSLLGLQLANYISWDFSASIITA